MTTLCEAVVTEVAISHERTPAGNTIAVLTLTAGDGTRPAVLGPQGLHNLHIALESITPSIAAGDFTAVVVAGNAVAFCAGADLDMMASITERHDSLALARLGHRVFDQLASLGVPVVAEIAGAALGGGLELALHCDYRIASESVRAIGLPELSLGLIPGWGGTTLLPRLIGLANAATVILDNPVKGNKLLNSAEALALGIVDKTAESQHLHDDVLRFIDDGFPVERVIHEYSTDELEAIRIKASSHSTRLSNPVVAIGRLMGILESTTNESSVDEEIESLADLILTPEFRNRVYSFHLTTQRARKPAGVPAETPRTISRIGVIGAGLMASQFATLFAERLKVPVIMTDVSQERLDSSITRISESLQSRVDRGGLTPEQRSEILSNLHTTLDMKDFAECDLVMEAVFEDLTVKLEVLAAVEPHLTATCILATNTSSLSVTEMAASLTHPSRLIGFHFFNPVAVMPLIEVVATKFTDDASLSTAISCAKDLRKTPVITKDLAGFVVNRILSVLLSEVFDCVDEGVTPTDISIALEPLRLPMDPFALIDLIGRPVTLHMIESLHQFAPDRIHSSSTLHNLTENPVGATVEHDIANSQTQTVVVSSRHIHDRVVDALAREIDIMLSEHVVADVADIDLCLLAGAGWPAAHGGISRYLDETGATSRVRGSLFHN